LQSFLFFFIPSNICSDSFLSSRYSGMPFNYFAMIKYPAGLGRRYSFESFVVLFSVRSLTKNPAELAGSLFNNLTS